MGPSRKYDTKQPPQIFKDHLTDRRTELHKLLQAYPEPKMFIFENRIK